MCAVKMLRLTGLRIITLKTQVLTEFIIVYLSGMPAAHKNTKQLRRKSIPS